VRKRQRRFEGFDDKILALYARGTSTRDIAAHPQEIYGVQVGRDLISRVTDAVMDDVRAWQQRPLDLRASPRPPAAAGRAVCVGSAGLGRRRPGHSSEPMRLPWLSRRSGTP